MSANTTQPAGMELPNMKELEAKYLQQRDAYDALIQDIEGKDLKQQIGTIADLNLEISDTLSKMMSLLDVSKAETEDIVFYRQKLEERLLKFQNDYNLLRSNRDEMETLRRIREYEEVKANTSLNLYLIGFALLCVVLVFVMFVFGRYRSSEPIYAIPSAATTMPAFT